MCRYGPHNRELYVQCMNEEVACKHIKCATCTRELECRAKGNQS